MNELYYSLVACAFTWLIAHFYYHRSSTQVPPWAKKLIQNLPDNPPKLNELLRLFQDYLDSGDIEIKFPLNLIVCPECGASAKDFEDKIHGDDFHTVIVYTCPSCGWSIDAVV